RYAYVKGWFCHWISNRPIPIPIKALPYEGIGVAPRKPIEKIWNIRQIGRRKRAIRHFLAPKRAI
ncbi:MAG: hypothetical protein WBM69_21960, partial [Desulfobacterales bacterium]